MLTLLAIIFFCFGLIIGSFLNVVILRYNTERTFGGRSACMSCKTTLSWAELIPLGSYLALGGRCRTCKVKISMQYPLVELVTGVVFSLLFIKLANLFAFNLLEFIFSYSYYAILFSLLIVLAAYDLRHKIIPDVFSFFFGLIAFLGIFFITSEGTALHLPSVLDFFAGPIIALPFVLLWFVSRGTWMGLGDGKLALGLGWMLGIAGATSAVVLAFWSGAVVGVALMLTRKNYKMKTEIPFGPFLVLGTMVAFLFDLRIFSGF